MIIERKKIFKKTTTTHTYSFFLFRLFQNQLVKIPNQRLILNKFYQRKVLFSYEAVVVVVVVEEEVVYVVVVILGEPLLIVARIFLI